MYSYYVAIFGQIGQFGKLLLALKKPQCFVYNEKIRTKNCFISQFAYFANLATTPKNKYFWALHKSLLTKARENNSIGLKKALKLLSSSCMYWKSVGNYTRSVLLSAFSAFDKTRK